MSCRSLNAMVMQKRQEIEDQLHVFFEKCDRVVSVIEKMKQHAHTLSDEMNCDPSEIKNKYLSCINILNEYNYDMELLLNYLDNPESTTSDSTSVHTESIQSQSIKPLTPISSMNRMYVLSESTPSTSNACINKGPPDTPVKKKIHKNEQLSIAFSSCSSESIPSSKTGKELQCEVANAVTNFTLKDLQLSLSVENIILPQQEILELDCTYKAWITYINGYSFHVVTDFEDVYNLMFEMNKYYNTHTVQPMCLSDLRLTNFCVFCDKESYCRAFLLEPPEEDKMSIAEVFLIDHGEVVRVSTIDHLLPLAPQFRNKPPFARPCHFAGVDPLGTNKEVDHVFKQYEHSMCEIRIEDNSSEEVGAYVVLPSGVVLNDLLVEYGLAKKIADKTPMEENTPVAAIGLPELSESNFDITDCPEYEDPLEAVTGYHNRDEMDICKNYKGGPEKTCFQGLRCNKRHEIMNPVADKTPMEKNTPVAAIGLPELSEFDFDITDCPEYEDPLVAVTGYHNRDEKDICKNYKGGPEKTCYKGLKCNKRHEIMNPDGWTLDKVPVIAKWDTLPLPAPGTVKTVTVKHVETYNSLFLHYVDTTDHKETLPEFGLVLPPTTLPKLVQDMNSPAARLAHKKFKNQPTVLLHQLIPAPGELVAALYPPDGHWYRAKVINVQHNVQNIEVMYIDYGNHEFVTEDAIRELHPRYLALPAQAVRCVLAGICSKTVDTRKLHKAKEVLFKIIQECTLQARVISRAFDDLTVELFDQGFSVAEQYAALMPDIIGLHDYELVDDTAAKPQIIAG